MIVGVLVLSDTEAKVHLLGKRGRFAVCFWSRCLARHFVRPRFVSTLQTLNKLSSRVDDRGEIFDQDATPGTFSVLNILLLQLDGVCRCLLSKF